MNRLGRPSRPVLAGLMYHDIANDPHESGFQRPGARPYLLPRGAFDAHLDAIAAAGCAPALVPELDLSLPVRHLLLTFDDGGRSALEVAARLQRRGWKAHFFVVTSRIGDRTFLDADGIRRLASAGHLIGTHSHTHPDIFRSLTPERMHEEWRSSREILEDILGCGCVAGSVPGGDLSDAVVRSAESAGLRYLFTSEPWLNPRRAGGCWVLGRYGVKSGASAATIRGLAEGRGWGRALLVRRIKGAARRVLPQLYRLYVGWTTCEIRTAGD
jgi:peptidoglycan/xylan/chitin deacetylase (PgdA/CDA1 family)